MGEGPRYRMRFRRRRTGQTDFGRRLGLLQGRRTRLVVRRSNRAILVQFVDFSPQGDLVRAAATSRDLGAVGWDGSLASTPAAYLTGYLAAQRAKGRGVTDAVLDLGRAVPTKGGRIFAAVKGVLDAGLRVPADKGMLPKPERLQGEHLPEAPIARFKNALQKLQAGAPAAPPPSVPAAGGAR